MVTAKRLPLLIVLTLVGSVLGASLVLVVDSKAMPLIISIAMIGMAGLAFANRGAGLEPAAGKPSRSAEWLGYIATFGLGIWGDFSAAGM